MLIFHHQFVNSILYLNKKEILEVTEELYKGSTRVIHKIERLAGKPDKTDDELKRLKRY